MLLIDYTRNLVLREWMITDATKKFLKKFLCLTHFMCVFIYQLITYKKRENYLNIKR